LLKLKSEEKILEKEIGKIMLVLIEWVDKNIEIKE